MFARIPQQSEARRVPRYVGTGLNRALPIGDGAALGPWGDGQVKAGTGGRPSGRGDRAHRQFCPWSVGGIAIAVVRPLIVFIAHALTQSLGVTPFDTASTAV
jgi:hypothetical protein